MSETRKQFVDKMYELHQEFASALSESTMDPARVMRLTATGVDFCIVALAELLEADKL